MSRGVEYDGREKVIWERDDRELMRCSPAQMRIALHDAGELAAVNLIALSDDRAAIVWEYATVILRNSPFIDALGTAHYTEEQIDGFFLEAMKVEV